MVLVIRQILETLAGARFRELDRLKEEGGKKVHLNMGVKGEYSDILGTHLTVSTSQICWTGMEFTFRVVFGRQVFGTR